MSAARDLRRLAALATALPRELRAPVSAAAARTRVMTWQATRGARLLDVLRDRVYADPRSPYRQLLEWAGCRYEDVAELVTCDGVDDTLQQLQRAGVYVTLDEFRGETPIVRGSRVLAVRPDDFDVHERAPRGAVSGRTSGSRFTPRRVTYSWPFIGDEAAHERLLYEAIGVADIPMVLWYPPPPSLAGIHNLLMDAKRGTPPSRWFSMLAAGDTGATRLGHAAPTVLQQLARMAGVHLPEVTHASLADVGQVLAALPPRGALRGYASAVARVADEAVRSGRDLQGVTLFTGGEPLTEERQQRIAASGARVYGRYVTTEAGVLAGSTPCRGEPDDMHLYTSRVACIVRNEALLVTGLSGDANVVLLNTDLGDTGTMTQRTCTCLLGSLGLTTHVHGVRSLQRLTAEGMTVSVHAFARAVTEAWTPFGVSTERVQLRATASEGGATQLQVAIDPDAGPLDESMLRAALLATLRTHGGALALAAGVWGAADTIHIRREPPRTTTGAKAPFFLTTR